jgi:ADP-ribose pyrophosphatase
MAILRNGPYIVRKRTEVYRNRWIRVRQDDVVAPDGTDRLFGIVDMGSGVAVLPIWDNGRVFLAREFKYAQETHTIEVFCGGVEVGETPLDAAQRELAEESGLAASEWTPMGRVQQHTTIVKTSGHLFVARGLSRLADPPKGDDEVEVIETDLDQAYAMVRRGDIIHAASCLLIALAYIDAGALR